MVKRSSLPKEKSTLDQTDVAYCREQVRLQTQDYFLCDLLLDEPARSLATVVHCFHAEISSLCLAAQEPMAGEIRLQWWVEVLEGQRAGEAQGNPLARVLLSALDTNQLSSSGLQAKLKAHIFDLYRDPMETRTMLEGWCGETRSTLFQIVALTAGSKQSSELADACGHAGVALGIAGLLENLAFHRSRNQVYVPTDLLSAMGLSSAEFLSETGAAQVQAVQAMVDLANEHHSLALTALSKIEGKGRMAFLPLALVPHYLLRIETHPMSAFTGLATVSQFRKQWILWRNSRKQPYRI